MDLFINGSSCISAFDTQQILKIENEDYYKCLEPDYKLIIEPNRLRRMSRIMRMGLATAINTMEVAKVQSPQAIITATGFGCLEDTGNFIEKMCNPDNRMMNPTAFIQSIHNTMGGLIAMHFLSNCYNNTFTQDMISFEHALLDTILLLEEGVIENVLLGGIDEITELKYELTSRLFKTQKESDGFYGQGEGSAFFSLSAVPSNVKLNALILSYETRHTDIQEYISKQLTLREKTLIFSGKSGCKSDEAYSLLDPIIETTSILEYKKFCGDYTTACSFATWLACEVLQKNIKLTIDQDSPLHVIIYHAYRDRPHTLIHLTRC